MGYGVLDTNHRGRHGGTVKLAVYRSDPLLGGLVNRYQPQALSESMLSESVNLDLTDPFRPISRDGYTLIGSGTTGIDAGLLAKRPAGLAVLSPGGAGLSRSMVMPIPNGGAGKTYRTTDTVGAWAEVLLAAASYDPGTDDCVMFQANDSLILIPASGQNVVAMSAAGALTDGGNVDDLAAVLGSPPRGAVDGCYFLNRAWLLKQDAPPTLSYSILLPTAAGIASQWARTGTYSPTGTAGRLQLSPDASAIARAVRPWSQTSLIVFFAGSVEEVIVGADDPFTNSVRHVLDPRYGTISRDSVVVIGNDLIFMDQYGELRALTQNVAAWQKGFMHSTPDLVNQSGAAVTARPISFAVKGELPDRLNFAAASKVSCVAYKDRLYVGYPRDSSTEKNAILVYNFTHGFWESLWLFAHPFVRMVASDIRGAGNNGYELFMANGTTSVGPPHVYRWFTNAYSDNGSEIAITESTKSFDGGEPENPKLYDRLELEIKADPLVKAELSMQVDEDGVWQQHSQSAQIPAGETDWPLLDSDFPLLTADFPLTDSTVALLRKQFSLEEFEDSVTRRGRFARFRFQSTPGVGKRIQRTGYRFTFQPEKNDWEPE